MVRGNERSGEALTYRIAVGRKALVIRECGDGWRHAMQSLCVR
jgi:hypothetical protein